MPTPFFHIRIALDLLDEPDLAEQARRKLGSQRGPFLLGCTAPDVQVVSGEAREATHFFALPFQPDAPRPWLEFLEIYPDIANATALPENLSAFIAGYLIHLQADWLWVKDIFAPVFGPACQWESFRHRLYLHNVLRSYLDREVLENLNPDCGRWLSSAEPENWLPFAQDLHLKEWRNYLAEQLSPGAFARTVEVFALRSGISPQEFYSLMESEQRMHQEIFSHLPRSKLAAYRSELLGMNAHLLNEYLSGESN